MEDKIETAITATGAGEFHEIREGAANILITEEAATFYNPIQEFNRDLT
jgi:tRNA G26 N,N-dimethylase Trm1